MGVAPLETGAVVKRGVCWSIVSHVSFVQGCCSATDSAGVAHSEVEMSKPMIAERKQ